MKTMNFAELDSEIKNDVAQYACDALGRRIETVDAMAGTTTRYYDDEQRAAVQTQVAGGGCQWEDFNNTTPKMISIIPRNLVRLITSPKQAMPTITVPTAPIPVQAQ